MNYSRNLANRVFNVQYWSESRWLNLSNFTGNSVGFTKVYLPVNERLLGSLGDEQATSRVGGLSFERLRAQRHGGLTRGSSRPRGLLVACTGNGPVPHRGMETSAAPIPNLSSGSLSLCRPLYRSEIRHELLGKFGSASLGPRKSV